MTIKLPFIYKKIAKKLEGNGGTLDFNKFKKEMMKTRITHADCRELAKDLEKHGVVILEAKKINQHLKIKVCKRGFAKTYTVMAAAMLSVMAYELGFLTILTRCCI